MKSHPYIVTKYGLELSVHTEDKVELIVACLLHDLGNKYCSLRKIVESEYGQLNDSSLKDLAYAYRIEHEKWSVEEAIKILEALRFKPAFILEVIKLIVNHDDWKVTKKDPTEINAILLREADVLWMLSPDGIQRDIDRAIENNLTPMTIKEQWDWNYNLVNKHIKYGREILERNKLIVLGYK